MFGKSKASFAPGSCACVEPKFSKPLNILLLGASGSIGTQTLDVIRKHPQHFNLVGATVYQSWDVLAQVAAEFSLSAVGIAHVACVHKLEDALKSRSCQPECIAQGDEGIVKLVAQCDCNIVVNALVGAAGVRASIAALEHGKVLALANKESLVVAGDLIMPLAKKRCKGSDLAEVLRPIDSEHGALWQCLWGECAEDLSRLWITASGGPFRNASYEELLNVSPDQALAHPTWNMGPKITIDSSTLMNKGLEVIEAHHLFDVPYDKISVVVQAQSAIHSMIEFIDGSVKAHMGTTDMRIPIQMSLSYPKRLNSPCSSLDFTQLGSLTFEPVNHTLFPCLNLAYRAGRAGGLLPCVMNAANEVAVDAFLMKKLRYLDIFAIIASTMDEFETSKLSSAGASSLEEILQADAWARKQACVAIDKH